jgi:hypothetical protein
VVDRLLASDPQRRLNGGAGYLDAALDDEDERLKAFKPEG